MAKNKKNIIALFLAIISLLSITFFSKNHFINTQASLDPTPQPTPYIKPADTASFVAVGDNLIHGSLYLQAAARSKDGGYDFDYAYENIEGYFKNFDIKFINQETLVNDAFSPSTYPMFSSPADLGYKVLDMGFNVIGTSNNHSYDKGVTGIKSSFEFWENSDAIHCGFYTGDDEQDIKYMTVNNIKIAFLAYTYGTNGLSIPSGSVPYVIKTDDFETIERQVKIAKSNADMVIVSTHWGWEDTNTVNDYQKDVASRLNKMGVDVIIGTHPHVIQPVEKLVDEETGQQTLICYSLGNFISAQSKLNNMLGGMFQFDIVKEYDENNNSKINIENVYFVPTITHFDSNYRNIRNYLLSDYTEELAQKHGVKAFDYRFTLEFMESIVYDIIPKEYLLYN